MESVACPRVGLPGRRCLWPRRLLLLFPEMARLAGAVCGLLTSIRRLNLLGVGELQSPVHLSACGVR